MEVQAEAALQRLVERGVLVHPKRRHRIGAESAPQGNQRGQDGDGREEHGDRGEEKGGARQSKYNKTTLFTS